MLVPNLQTLILFNIFYNLNSMENDTNSNEKNLSKFDI